MQVFGGVRAAPNNRKSSIPVVIMRVGHPLVLTKDGLRRGRRVEMRVGERRLCPLYDEAVED